MKQIAFTLKLYSLPEAAYTLGYSLSFMNEICKRAFISHRPFFVVKDENGKYFVESNSFQRYLETCPDSNLSEIPGVFEPDSVDEDAPADESVFMLTEDMLPQVCGVMTDEECAPLVAYHSEVKAYQDQLVRNFDDIMVSVNHE